MVVGARINRSWPSCKPTVSPLSLLSRTGVTRGLTSPSLDDPSNASARRPSDVEVARQDDPTKLSRNAGAVCRSAEFWRRRATSCRLGLDRSEEFEAEPRSGPSLRCVQ